MKKIFCLVVVCAATGVGAGAKLATQEQALVMGALEELKFEFVKDSTGKVGGPANFKVTDATIKSLQAIKKNGTKIVVGNDGTVTVGDKK